MSDLRSILTLEYGEPMPAEYRSGHGFPVFGSNGEVGRHVEFLVPEPGIIVGRKGSVGKVCWSDEPFWPIDTTYWVKCARRDLRWIYWVLTWLPLARLDSSTGVPGLNRNDVYSLTISLPFSSERTKIAEILDTLDTAIHATEAIITKLKAVKQGLLHDLLTRGIDENGELRPPQAEAPERYKASPLGWIPKEWEAKLLGDLLADVDPSMRSGPFGSALLKHELTEVGHPLLGIDNVHAEKFVAEYTRFVSPQKFAQLSRYAVRANDLMITIMGTVGRCCLVPLNVGQALSSKHTWTISLDQEAYSPYLAMLQVNYSPWVLEHFARDQQGGTMSAIRSETLRSTLLPCPTRAEQYLIEERLHELSARIQLELQTLAKRHAQKSGLMDDLLTGRVRVTPLLDTTSV
jgi:type I restriction enzyme S subunit